MKSQTAPAIRQDEEHTNPKGKNSFPFLDLRAQYAGIRDEVNAAVLRVLESQHFILGPEVAALEEEIAKYVECRFAVGCASGSDALLLALMALGIGPGDEVLTPPFTFVATAGSIARLGARPVFVDIDPHTFNMDPRAMEKTVTPRTKAIMPVHLFGLAADLEPMLDFASRRGIPVIEDCAQAIGAKYHRAAVGSLGAVGCFSFFPSKNLGGAGDGGVVSTNDAALAERLRVLRSHGSRTKYNYELLGVNSRLDALQAAILRVKLPYLDLWAAGRQRNAARYHELLGEFELAKHVKPPGTPANCIHTYNQYVVCVQERDALRAHLQRAGIPTEVYYPHPLHLQKAFAHLGYAEGDFPQSETLSKQVVALPVYPELTDAQLHSVVAGIADFYRQQE